MNFKLKYTALIILIISLTSCFNNTSEKVELEQKIGQMLMFGFRGNNINDEWVQTIKQQTEDLHLGGILILSYNIVSPSQTDSLMAFLKGAKTKHKLLLAIDQEGGRVQRLSPAKGFRGFPSAQQIAETMSLEEAFETYTELAKECKQYGFNYILAPVVDVNVNPESPAIGNLERSYSADPNIVSEYASAFIEAISNQGLIACLKHFPGHGSATIDSHLGMTDVTNTWQEQELIPYLNLINTHDLPSIMSAHIFHSEIDSLYPASLSYQHINNLLRNELSYNGVVISDDLQMGAIVQHYNLEETVIKAINAGSDILIFSQYFNPNINLPIEVINIIKKAVSDGVIPKQRIEESYNRIIKMKKQIR